MTQACARETKAETTPQLMVALDFPDGQKALDFMAALMRASCGCGEPEFGRKVWAKVGLELFTAAGPAIVAQLKNLGFKVFLDMKFHDIPNTVRGAVCMAVLAGADMVNIHVCGGERMAHGALVGLKEGCERSQRTGRPLLIGVTVLTSIDAADWASLYGSCASGAAPGAGFSQTVSDAALSRATLAKAWGLDGVVCSGHEVKAIKERLGTDFFCVVPGIRPAWARKSDDQRRVMTPGEAVQAGADFLVIGRPLTQAQNPVEAVKAVLDEMEKSGKQGENF